MYCKNCGKEIYDDSAFCQFCGTKQNEEKQNVAIENKKICSVCGEEFITGKGYCPFCTADYIPQEQITDEFGCGQLENAHKKEQCKYTNYCIHEECPYSKKYKDATSNIPHWSWLWSCICAFSIIPTFADGYILSGIILIILFMLLCPPINTKIFEKIKNKMDKDLDSTEYKFLRGVAIAFLLIALFIAGVTHNSEEKTAQMNAEKQARAEQLKKEEAAKQEKQKQEQAQQQKARQARLNTINNLINEAHKGGLIIKIDRFDMDGRKCAYMIVDEYVWNQLPHETKQHMCRMVNEYNDLTGETILAFKGYRTGKTIMPFEFSVHNFE